MADITSGPRSAAGPASLKPVIPALIAVWFAFWAMTTPAALLGLIQGQLHTSAAQLNWVSAIFFIPTASLELTFGVLGDRFGRKPLLISGGALLAIGAGLGAFSVNGGMLLAGQALGGIGTAVILPTSLAIVASETANSPRRARVVTLWALGMSMGAAVGPLVAGLVGLSGNFHTAYVIVAGLAIILIIVSAALARNSKGDAGRRIDLPGQITFFVGLTALLYGIIQGANASYRSPEIVAAFVVGVVALFAFVVIEIRTRDSLINTRLFASISYSGYAVVAVLGAIVYFGFNYGAAIRVAVLQGQTSLAAGLVSTLQIVGQLVLWPFIARWLARVHPRFVLVGGLAALGLGTLWIGLIPIQDTSLWTMTPALIIVGIGFIAMVSSTSAAAVDVPLDQEGVAAGTINMARDTGAAVGISVVGAIAVTIGAKAIPAFFASGGLHGQALAAGLGALQKAGPMALVAAPPGTFPPGVSQAAQQALWHGFSLGMVGLAVLALVSIIITMITTRVTSATRSVDAPARTASDRVDPAGIEAG